MYKILNLILQIVEESIKFESRMYPIITTKSILTSDIMKEMNNLQVNFLPELKRFINELDSKIKEFSFLGLKGNILFFLNKIMI